MTEYGVLVQIGEGDGTKTGPLRRVDGSSVQRLEKMIASLFRGFALNHPCIGARSVFVNGNMYFGILPDMRSYESALRVVELIEQYLEITDCIDNHIKTLALIFIENAGSQEEFEKKYWNFVQKVHNIDCLTNEWDPKVSSSIDEKDFELSVAGRAIFTTTLNPASARIARKFAYPVWVCNQIQQFDKLREIGQFSQWQNSIRAADKALDPSGEPNPILMDHGEGSAVTQLAGSNSLPCPLLINRSSKIADDKVENIFRELREAELSDEILDKIRRRVEISNN